MIYNAASFMDTPWETIIKVYRKQLKDRSFPTVKAYVDDFIRFLAVKNYFTDEKTQKDFLFGFFNFIIQAIVGESLRDRENLLENPTENAGEIIQIINDKTIELLNQIQQNEVCPDLESYQFEDFTAFANELLNSVIEHHFTKNGFQLEDELKDRIKLIIFHYLRMKEENTGFTGLVFVGFGEEEIYPQLVPVDISFVVQNRLRYFIDTHREASISNEINGAIRPFAQTDVIDTILTGVDPKLENSFFGNFSKLFTQYNAEILKIMGDANPELSAQIKGLDLNSITQEYFSLNTQIKQSNFLIPLMKAVSSLSKEDLAEMAESLIYLTYLKRRITFAEDSVGGPVDVALISKGDGFIWIKRKQYFRPELNQNFNNNYLNA
jgi:hypothetical protein